MTQQLRQPEKQALIKNGFVPHMLGYKGPFRLDIEHQNYYLAAKPDDWKSWPQK